MGEHTVNHIDKDTSQYDNQRTASISIYLLFRARVVGSVPNMGHYIVNDIVHESLPFTERAKDTGDSGDKRQSEKGIKPEVEPVSREERGQERDKVVNHTYHPYDGT